MAHDDEESSSKALTLVTKLQELGLEGKVPGMKSSIELAAEYLGDSSYGSHEDRIKSLIRYETSKTAGSGFLTGVGGLVTLPVSLPAGLGAAWIVQVRMVGAIAHLRGWNLGDDRVRTLCLATLLGDAMAKEIGKHMGTQVAMKGGKAAVGRISGKAIIDLNKKVGFRLVTKGGQKGVLNLGKAVPLLGGIVGGGVDATATRAVGGVAKRTFHARPQDGFGVYAPS